MSSLLYRAIFCCFFLCGDTVRIYTTTSDSSSFCVNVFISYFIINFYIIIIILSLLYIIIMSSLLYRAIFCLFFFYVGTHCTVRIYTTTLLGKLMPSSFNIFLTKPDMFSLSMRWFVYYHGRGLERSHLF